MKTLLVLTARSKQLRKSGSIAIHLFGSLKSLIGIAHNYHHHGLIGFSKSGYKSGFKLAQADYLHQCQYNGNSKLISYLFIPTRYSVL